METVFTACQPSRLCARGALVDEDFSPAVTTSTRRVGLLVNYNVTPYTLRPLGQARPGGQVLEPMSLNDDLLSPELIRDPYPMLRALRETAPVYWNARWKGWVVTSYDLVSEAHKNPAMSNDKYAPFARMKTPTEDQREVFRWLGLWLGSQDAPLHTRLRGAIQCAFTTRSSMEALEPILREETTALLDDAERRGEMDLVRDFAYPLTTTVIGSLLGMPREDLHRVPAWADAVAPILFMTLGVPDRYRVAREQLDDMAAYFRGLLQRRLEQPEDDLLTSLAEAMDRGELSQDEVVATCMVVIFGGHETTKDLIGNGMLALLRDPDQLQRLRSDSALLPTAVEELLRFDSPAKSTVRWAMTDTEVGGQSIEEGQRLLMFWSAANRDPAHFDSPDCLDLARQPNRHLGFGKGVHYCIGAPLGRMEGVVALEQLVDRFPRIRLAVPDDALTWRPTIIMRSLESLPVLLG